MEVVYQIESIYELQKVNCKDVRWLSPDDLLIVQEHLSYQNRTMTIEKWEDINAKGINYCGVILKGKMIGRACVERYSQNKWETADVRILPEFRNQGYGKQVVYFITKYILDNGKIATCRTRIKNLPMQQLAISMGFKEKN
jgi:RimJ/RimL family protein N-acetyltransferase